MTANIVDAVQKVLENANKVTKEQIITFLEICRSRYLRAKIEPGESICSSEVDANVQVRRLVLSERNQLVNRARK